MLHQFRFILGTETLPNISVQKIKAKLWKIHISNFTFVSLFTFSLNSEFLPNYGFSKYRKVPTPKNRSLNKQLSIANRRPNLWLMVWISPRAQRTAKANNSESIKVWQKVEKWPNFSAAPIDNSDRSSISPNLIITQLSESKRKFARFSENCTRSNFFFAKWNLTRPPVRAEERIENNITRP